MQFNPVALAHKQEHLDRILNHKELLERVLAGFAGGAQIEYTLIQRPWSPGGGSTLFKARFGNQERFLKAKHLSVTVESKLEGEAEFSSVGSLKNEYEFLKTLKPLSSSVPQSFQYMEAEGFGFLLVESLSSFMEGIKNLSAMELVAAYDQIEALARLMFTKGMAHTDIHELNILFRGPTPVLIDFEEARYVEQPGLFEESLDYQGINSLGNVGTMPTDNGALPGYTCLKRLREVFKRLVNARIEPLIKSCNFDSTCPFLATLDHGKDDRIYQSITLPNLTIQGQRPVEDDRIRQILEVFRALFDRPVTHLDIGSNLGRFNLELAKHDFIRLSVGVEAYSNYVDLAKVLAFLSDNHKVRFLCAECGTHSLSKLLESTKIDCVTIYSVYHHIRNKAAFLADLKRLDPKYLLFEMAVQPECYDGKTWQQEIASIGNYLGMPYGLLLSFTADYQRPIVLFSKQDVSEKLKPVPPAPQTPQPVKAVASAPAAAPAAARATMPARKPGSPRLSVILPTYNHLSYLPMAIEGLMAQTFRDFELIIVNDGSTDGTREFLDGLKEPRIRVIHQENRRLPGALNAGMSAAQGELLTWTSSDNYCAPIFLEALVNALDRHPEAGFAYSSFAWVNETGKILGILRNQDFSLRSLLKQNPGNASFLYRRKCHEEVGLYDTELEGAEDWDMWLRIVEKYPTVYVPEILYYYRLHGQTMTVQQRPQVRRAMEQAFLKALDRHGGEFDLARLYPALPKCRNAEQAQFCANFDLGSELLLSPAAPPAIACQFLEEAFSFQPNEMVAANLVVGYARASLWHKADRILPQLGQSQNVQVRKVVEQIGAARGQNRPELLVSAPLFGLNKSEYELFQTPGQPQLIYSLTQEGAVSRQPSTSRTPSSTPSSQASTLVTEVCASPAIRTHLKAADEAFAKGNLAAAGEALQMAVELDPQAIDTIECLGSVLFQLGEHESALREFIKVISLKPDRVTAYVKLAITALQLDRIEVFEEALEKALSLDPQNRDALKLLADLNLKNESYQQAAITYGKILNQTPNDVDVLLALGICFAKVGERDTARLVYQRILEIAPDNALAGQNLEVLRANPTPPPQADPVAAVSAPPVVVATERPKLRITYLISSILGVTGGNQTLLRQANVMAERGHQVTIVTCTPKPGWFNFKTRVIQVPAGKPMAACAPPSDVVVSTYFANTAELLNVDAPVKVYYAQGDQYVFEDDSIGAKQNDQNSRLFRELSKLSYQNPTIRFVANSNNLAQAVEKKYGRRADAILPVCVDQTIFRPLPRPLQGSLWRLLIVGPDSLGSPTEPLEFKGILDIRNALELLARRNRHFTAVRMSSTGPEIFRSFPCEFHMAPPDELKTFLYGTAHVLLYASHYDSCPRPPQEAMAAGAAVVCTATPGAMEYCRQDENCLLVPIRSPEAIAKAVERLITDEPLRQRLIEGGLATARQYPREREWDEWESMLYRFLEEKTPPLTPSPTSRTASQPAEVATGQSSPKPAPASGTALHQTDAANKIVAPHATKIELAPAGKVGRLKTGYELLQQKRYLDAWKAGVAALKVRPFHPEAYVMLGQIAQAAGDIGCARRCGERALRLTPHYDLAREFMESLPRHGLGAARQWPALPNEGPGNPAKSQNKKNKKTKTNGGQESEGASTASGTQEPKTKSRLSVCLIAKNEEQFLGPCLASIKDLAHQIIVVDTGSTDRTIEIAKEYGAEIYHFAWNENFSDARNVSLEHATGDWILILDADEELPASEHPKLLKDMSDENLMGYRLPIINKGLEAEGRTFVPRLFRNAPGLFFVARVHEQIFTSVVARAKEWKMNVTVGTATLLHHGYNPEVIKDRQKIERNLRLLEKAIDELPYEPHLVMNLGLELVRSDRLDEGVKKYFEAVDLMLQEPNAYAPELREALLTQLTTALVKQQNYQEVLRVAESPLTQSLGMTASLHYMTGFACLQLKQYDAAAEHLRQCVAKRDVPVFSPIVKEIHSVAPRHCLANCLFMQDKTAEADQAFREALEEDRESRAVRFDYARFLFLKGQPVGALTLLHGMVAEQTDDLRVWELGGKVALSRPEFLDFAQDWSTEAIAHFPDQPSIQQQRAEILMYSQEVTPALEFWRKLPHPRHPSQEAAILLCEMADAGHNGTLAIANESTVSQEFIGWYRRLLDYNANQIITRINQRLDVLRPVLPSAAQVLSAVVSQASD